MNLNLTSQYTKMNVNSHNFRLYSQLNEKEDSATIQFYCNQLCLNGHKWQADKMRMNKHNAYLLKLHNKF